MKDLQTCTPAYQASNAVIHITYFWNVGKVRNQIWLEDWTRITANLVVLECQVFGPHRFNSNSSTIVSATRIKLKSLTLCKQFEFPLLVARASLRSIVFRGSSLHENQKYHASRDDCNLLAVVQSAAMSGQNCWNSCLRQQHVTILWWNCLISSYSTVIGSLYI